MTTLRFLFILLLALNALAFAAIRGWLGSAAPGGEPERVTNQLNPEQIRLVTAGADDAPTVVTSVPEQPTSSVGTTAEPASEPSSEPTTKAATETEVESPPQVEAVSRETQPAAICVAWGELAADAADSLAARLNAAGIKFSRSKKDTPSNWWVRVPPQGSRALAEQKVRELREQGITDTFIVQESGPAQFAISLGLFRTEKSAQLLLAQVRTKGVRDAGVEPRLTTTYRIQATLPQDKVATVEGRRSPLGSRRERCTP